MNDMNLNSDTVNLTNIQKKKLILHNDQMNELLNIDAFAVVREKDRSKDSRNKKKQTTFDNNTRRKFFDFEIIEISQVFTVQVFNNQFNQSNNRRKREEHKRKRDERGERRKRDENSISEMLAHMMSSFTF